MKLNVPFYKQPDNKTCGIACVKMVLDFYKHHMPFKAILLGIKRGPDGQSYLPDLGNFFLNHGFKATIMLWHNILPAQYSGMGNDEALATLSNIGQTNVGSYSTSIHKQYKTFCDNGGKFFIRNLTLRLLETSIVKMEPPIMILDIDALHYRSYRYMNSLHAVVLQSMGNKNLAILDPLFSHPRIYRKRFIKNVLNHNGALLFVSR